MAARSRLPRSRAPRRDPEARTRAFEALRLMRRQGRSLTRAAREAETTPETVRKHVTPALFKEGRRWQATASDRLTRRVRFLTSAGETVISVRGSRAASRVAEHWEAVRKFLATGDARALREFRGQRIRTGSGVLRFVTDPRTLERLQLADEPSFDRLYVLRS